MTRRILVVEDSATQAMALTADLEEAGYEVTVARDGDEGLERFHEGGFDLVISDIVMPGALDGYDLCRRIKEEVGGEVPVLLLTSLSDPMDIIHGLESGADNFLTKPYDAGLLLERLKNLIQVRRAREGERFSMGVKILFMGKEFHITSEREQILDLLVTTFEEAVRQNRQLRQREAELTAARSELASYARSLERRLEQIAKTVPEVLHSASPDLSAIHYVSDAVRDVFLCEPEEFSVDYLRRHIHPADRDRVLTALESVRKGKEIRTVEYRFLAAPDRGQWVSHTLIPVRNETDTIIRLDGVARDVTERKNAEEALRRSEERYRSLVTATAQIVWTADPEGSMGGTLPAWREFTGQTEGEVRHRGWLDVVHPDDRERARADWQEALDRIELYRSEYRVRRHDGVYRYFSVRGAPVLTEDGEIREWVGTCTDITERKEAEERLRRHAGHLEILQEITEATQEMEKLDEALRFTVSHVCRRLGWPVGRVYFPPMKDEEDEGLVASDIWHLEDEARFGALKAAAGDVRFTPGVGLPGRVLQSGDLAWVTQPADDLTSVQLAEAAELGVRSALAVPVDRRRKLVAVAEFLMDTPLEPDPLFLELMRQVAEQLGRVAEREQATKERELVEAQVRQAQKMEAVGRLAGGIAHDFNNLLTVILGEAEMTLAQLPEDDQGVRPSVEEIRRGGERAAALTRQLLTFSRRDVPRAGVVNPNDVVGEMKQMLQRIIGEDVRLDMRLAEKIRPVRIDKGQFGQVIMNLVVNAKDAMPGGGSIVVETREVELGSDYPAGHARLAPGRYTLVAVTDTGTGIPPELREKIFDPFFTTKERDKGTGLGLATSYGIIKEAGGKIAVYSEMGIGTAMKIYLPPAGEEDEDRTAPTEPAVFTGTETILVAEDDDDVRSTSVRMLRRLGYTVLEARTGREALDLISSEGPRLGLVLSDVVFPDLEGAEIADRLAEVAPSLPILFTSGYTGETVFRNHLLVNDVQILEKPFTSKALGLKVREMLDARPSNDAD